jgi:MoaA/NifB/PqqE/SkfB family radical SAM enzyme
LKQAGLFSVSVSLDHWKEERHDQVRKYKGAFRAALEAIAIFKSVDGMHVSVSAVLSKEMLKQEIVEEFLRFLKGLDIHEVWLSEAKPSTAAYQSRELVVTHEERMMLIGLQDRYNKAGGMTINYLGHFEDERYFGCTAGHKMLYIDAFGEVSPCVFIPMAFGNIRESSVQEIYTTMLQRFPSENSCFMNKNFETLQKHSYGNNPIGKADSLKLVEQIEFGPLAKFFSLQYRNNKGTDHAGY